MKLTKLLAVGLMATLFAAPALAQEGGRLARIAQSGEIVLGHRESSLPFAYLDSNQQPVGYSLDLCHAVVDAVAEHLGRELNVRYVPVTPQNRIPLLANGTIDIECGSTTNNLTRQEQVEYLPITFITGTKLLVRTASGIETVDDLDGRAIALAQGTTNERVILAEIEARGLNVTVIPVRDHAEGMLALETDRVDAYSTDHILLFGLISRSRTPDAFAVVGDFLSYDPYALMIPRDDSAFELIGKRALAALFRSGEINEIYDRWFGPMGVEMDELLAASFRLNALPE